MINEITVLIVDDEKPARGKLTYFLDKETGFRIVGTAENGTDAIELIHALRPDVVFLDIQMPYPDGVEVVLRIEGKRPVIVFTTAYDEYAIKAFELETLDYLLKPFDSLRFKITIDRLRKHFALQEPYNNSKVTERAAASIQQVREMKLKSLTVKHGEKFVVIPLHEIFFFEAEGNYIRIHTKNTVYLMRQTMTELLTVLENTSFIRVQRSFIINVHEVKEIHPHFNGEYMVYMKNEKKVPCSRTFRDVLQAQFRI
ncbi:MAG: response regulator transcription factor [Ignavibacteriales bacterium]|nr:response regulator transcription factor [Ignavibacteriales bacterium]